MRRRGGRGEVRVGGFQDLDRPGDVVVDGDGPDADPAASRRGWDRAGQSKTAQLTASIRAAPVWCACLVGRVDVAKKKEAVRRPVESVTL